MSHRRSLWALGFISLAAAQSAQAQQETAVPTAPPVSSPVVAVPTEPELPRVSDPLLFPPPPPAKLLSSWQQALAMVRDESSSIRFARAKVLQAQGNARQALAPSLPQLSGTGTFTRNLIKGSGEVGVNGINVPLNGAIPTPDNSWIGALGLTVPVFHPFDWYSHGTARDLVHVAQLSGKEQERLAVAEVAERIVSVVTAERLAEVSRASLKAALSTVDLTKRRAALGDSNTLDVLRVEGEASLSRAQVVASTESLIRAREALGTALGMNEAWGVTADIQIGALGADAQHNCRLESDIVARTDVRAAQASLGVAERQLRGVDYAYLPTLDGVSTFSVLDPVSGINNRHETWTIGAVLNWNIYDGGLRGGQRESAAANVDTARANLAETKRSATLQVTQALRAVNVAEANLAVSARTRDIDSETTRLSKLSFLNGSGTSFDLVTTEASLRVAEVDLAVKEFDVLEAKIAALLALSTCSI